MAAAYSAREETGVPISAVYTPDGKHIRNVCGAAEIVVVEGDQDTVFG